MDKQQLTKDLFTNYSFIISDTVKEYINKNDSKCINEFEILRKIGEGAIWKVYIVNRYFYIEDNEIQTEQYAMKKTHLGTQKRRRYFKNDQMISYYDKVINEIEIMGILSKSSNDNGNGNGNSITTGNINVIQIQELIYSQSHQFLYLITDYCDIGPIMNRDTIDYNHYHNPKLIQFFIKANNDKDQSNKITLEYDTQHNTITNNDNDKEEDHCDLIKSLSLPLGLKHQIAKVLFKQIIQGIQYIHSKRIAHRDIKMENILFNSIDKQVKIIDFSISTILTENEIEINEPGGSMHYQAPELFSSDTKGYYEPFKADMWSIGICLYIFIYEQFPFDAESELELQMKILNNELKHPFHAEDEGFMAMVKGLLDKNPLTRLTDYDKILQMKYFN